MCITGSCVPATCTWVNCVPDCVYTCVCCGLGAQIVPHIPPTLCNLYQHGGDLLYLQVIRVQCAAVRVGRMCAGQIISTLRCCVCVCWQQGPLHSCQGLSLTCTHATTNCSHPSGCAAVVMG